MAVVLVVLCVVCGWLLVQYIRGILEIRSLNRQLEELERGSHMELGMQSRQKDMLELCRRLNRLQNLHHQEQIQYERAEKQLKQNITGLAHDIRTPLTGAAGYVQLAQECGEPQRQAYYLQVASDRLGELGDMLEELFLYTKLTSEEFALDMREVQV
ncbi:MAG: sensor histidine kinase, partial [Acetatifactor sp.]|nr:sensor histidine kinase [Acetatifactor sp.]